MPNKTQTILLLLLVSSILSGLVPMAMAQDWMPGESYQSWMGRMRQQQEQQAFQQQLLNHQNAAAAWRDQERERRQEMRRQERERNYFNDPYRNALERDLFFMEQRQTDALESLSNGFPYR